MNFFKQVIILIGLILTNCSIFAWEKELLTCPLICTCQLQHLTEIGIYRFMQKDKNKFHFNDETNIFTENNEVMYDENFDDLKLLTEENQRYNNIIIRSATCILQTETDPAELIDSLSSNIESLTFIQAYKSGNKTIKFSWLNKFEKLLSLELIGPTIFNKDVQNHLLCHIDYALENLIYLNLERVLVKNSKEQIQSFLQVLKDTENITFEYVQKIDGGNNNINNNNNNIHPLTIIQKNINLNDEIIPYKVYKEQRQNNGEIPLFIGFKKLGLLRIANCELNRINWEMFDGLNDLEYLILEKNNLTIISPFAFYGTPQIRTLSLAHNKLLDIQITDLAGLLQLEYLDLTYNHFTQLSEFSFPPFPQLKLADFSNNPIEMILPTTFEVMNTTDSLIIGSKDMALQLLPNSFAGLRMLKILTVNNVNVSNLQREFFTGMPQLTELILTGNIRKIEYDAFQEVRQLETLILNNCNITNISMDGFLGLRKVKYLDLSKNQLEYLPAGVFDDLKIIQEIYLNGNKLRSLPRDIFSKINPKLLRLNDNPWHCSCEMSEWKPIIANRIRQKIVKNNCDFNKGIINNNNCINGDNNNNNNNNNKRGVEFKYVYNKKFSPTCSEPEQFKNWSVFHTMRVIFQCADYKPKYKKSSLKNNYNGINSNNNKILSNNNNNNKSIITTKKSKLKRRKYLNYKQRKQQHILLNNKKKNNNQILINMENYPDSMELKSDSSDEETNDIFIIPQ